MILGGRVTILPPFGCTKETDNMRKELIVKRHMRICMRLFYDNPISY